MYNTHTHTHTHTRACVYIYFYRLCYFFLLYINKLGGGGYPICACAIQHFLTQLSNALAECYLQCTTRQRDVTYNVQSASALSLTRRYDYPDNRERYGWYIQDTQYFFWKKLCVRHIISCARDNMSCARDHKSMDEIICRAHQILCRAHDIIFSTKKLRVLKIPPYNCHKEEVKKNLIPTPDRYIMT